MFFEFPTARRSLQWPLPSQSFRSLVVWFDDSGSGISGLRIAVSVANGQPGSGILLFRPSERQPKTVTEPFGFTLDRLGRTNRVCIASRSGVVVADTTNASVVRSIDLRSQMETADIITSLQSVRTNPNLVLLTIRNSASSSSQHRLNLLEIDRERLLLDEVVGLGNRQNPLLAVDPSGTFVAATADVAVGIQLFELNRLRQQESAVSQVLRSEFQAVRRASVVSSDQGSRLRLELQDSEDVRSFEFGENQMLPQRAQPHIWNSSAESIQFARVGRSPEFADVSNDASTGALRVRSSIPPIGKRIEYTTPDGQTIPLAAVASIQYDAEAEPRLALYNPTTNREYRRLNGHLQVVTHIEFSSDQRHLTTVSADGMVCVWSLADLVNLIGKRGAIDGVRWCNNENGIQVSVVDDEATSQLRPGDIIIGLVEQARLIEYVNSERLFLALSHTRPGGFATVRVRRGDRELDVPLELKQGTDERKPLLSFISRTDPTTGLLDWLLWTPSGPISVKW